MRDPGARPRWSRVGRDNSFYVIGRGVVGIGIPVWLGWVALYLVLTLSAVVYADQLPPGTANRIAGGGPAWIGLIDLVQRLRATDYVALLLNGQEVTRPASLIDRLTFRECGWYLPLLALPLPLWLLGLIITTLLLTP
ncbi:MAG: conserved rane protein of unknown function [Proteobacteria bacterium]|nr:conserved rane protein of unknown function [Pseudomonadota bacterium]MBS1229265.1 conserved rane protein of unknown function [Pseudomonadota bacterium]